MIDGAGRLAAFTATLVVAGACGGRDPGPAPPPDVVLVVIDTLRADHVSAYGYEKTTSPVIDAIAEAGVLFEVAYAPMGTTVPAHASLFTGLQPHALGLVRNGMSLVDEAVTLAERVGEAGYATAAFVSSYPVSHRFGLQQGFDHFDDHFAAGESTYLRREWQGIPVGDRFDRRAEVTIDRALQWLEGATATDPLFLWVHLFDPHGPFGPPADHARGFYRSGIEGIELEVAMYDGEIHYADAQLGRLVEALERRPTERELLLVVTGDHGEGLWDHGWRQHDRFTYEEELRVPLVMRWPKRLPAGRRLSAPVQLADLAPTILAAVGLPNTISEGDAMDLLPMARGESRGDASRVLHFQRPRYEPGRVKFSELGWGAGLRSGRWKYFEAPEEGRIELFDLESDPHERKNLATEDRGQALEFSRLVRTRMLSPPGTLAVDETSNRDEEALRALGYAED